jgi:hypothetical protein
MLKLCAAQLRQHYPVKGAGESPASLAEFIMAQRKAGVAPVIKSGSRSQAEEGKKEQVEGERLRAEMATPPASPRLEAGFEEPSNSGAKKIVWLEVGGGLVSLWALDWGSDC